MRPYCRTEPSDWRTDGPKATSPVAVSSVKCRSNRSVLENSGAAALRVVGRHAQRQRKPYVAGRIVQTAGGVELIRLAAGRYFLPLPIAGVALPHQRRIIAPHAGGLGLLSINAQAQDVAADVA